MRPRGSAAGRSGGGANIDWLARYWGEAARNYLIRGLRYNDGTVLDLLLRAGAARMGEERGFHAVAIVARSPLDIDPLPDVLVERPVEGDDRVPAAQVGYDLG